VCLIATIIVATAASSSDIITSTSKHIVYISIPLPGHLGPLIAQGQQLAQRGWHVSIATPNKGQNFVNGRIAAWMGTNPSITGSLSYLSAGDCKVADEATQLFLSAAVSPDWAKGSQDIFRWATRLSPCMYAAIIENLKVKGIVPALIVGDASTWVAVDIANDMNVPLAVNNADLLYLLSSHVIPPYDGIPGMMAHTTAASMKESHGLAQRVLYPPIRLILMGVVQGDLQRTVDEQRAIYGSTSKVSVFDAHRGKLVIVDSAFGLEYPRPLPPLVHMVGPMIVDESLSAEDKAWLEADERPAVFVSFGTIAPIDSKQAAILVEGLRSDSFRAILKLDKSLQHVLPPSLPPNVRVESWVSSQLAHLAHPKVKVFISHCGINSAHESVYYQTAILCIPMFGDQLDMGYRVADAGVGAWLDKLNFTSEEVTSNVNRMIADSDGSIARSLAANSHALKMAGGAKRAADLIEHVALYGVSHLATPDVYYPTYALYQLDQYAIWAILLLIPLSILRCCYRSCRRRKQVSSKHISSNGEANGDVIHAKLE